MALHKKTFDDPFDNLSDEEFEAEITHAIEERAEKGLPIEKVGDAVPISLRMDRSVLTRIKALTKERGIPYQRLMKSWIEDGLVATEREKAPTLRVVLSDADIQRVAKGYKPVDPKGARKPKSQARVARSRDPLEHVRLQQSSPQPLPYSLEAFPLPSLVPGRL